MPDCGYIHPDGFGGSDRNAHCGLVREFADGDADGDGNAGFLAFGDVTELWKPGCNRQRFADADFDEFSGGSVAGADFCDDRAVFGGYVGV